MVSPWSILSVSAPQAIDDYIKDHHTQLNVYVDLKNVMNAIFIEDVAQEMILNSDMQGTIDSSIFQGVIANCSYWKRFCQERNMDCKIFICTDMGDSNYHLCIDKKYKCRRKISRVDGAQIITGLLDDRVKQIRDKNFVIAEKALNRIPNVYFFVLRYLESDFLCHYLIKEKYNEEHIFHVIASSDKDMYQTVTQPNIVQINKNRRTKFMYDQESVLPKYTGFKKASVKVQTKRMEQYKMVDNEMIPAMMALVGDDGDDVPGVKTIGPGRSLEIFANKDMISQMVGSMDELNERVFQGGKFFLEDNVPLRYMSKILQKCFLENDLVTRAFKLISYDQLVMWLKQKNETKKIDWINYIDDVLNKKEISMIPSAASFMTGLNKLNDIQLNERDIIPLFE